MLNRDQIIKGCEFAKGFVVSKMGSVTAGWLISIDIENTISIGMGAILGEGDQHSHDIWCKIYHPLFITRIIEGINLKSTEFSITQNQFGMCVKNANGEQRLFTKLDSADHNKLCAVEYILDKIGK